MYFTRGNGGVKRKIGVKHQPIGGKTGGFGVRTECWRWSRGLMLLGADFLSCGEVSSFYSELRIRLRVHAPQGSCPSMTNPYMGIRHI